MLKINNLNIKKGNKTILNNINLEFKSGKIYAILGANGVGKSTLLDAIFQLDKKHNMTYRNINSDNLKKWQSNIGYMLQSFHTHTNLSALEVVLLGAYNELGLKISDEILNKAVNVLKEFKISHLANINIKDLSGGQRQMIAFAQVLLKNPSILLLDEPVSALDIKHQCILLEALKKITIENDLISIVVLHDLNLASLYCDEAIFLHNNKVYKNGKINDVITLDLIREIYEIKANLSIVENKKFIQILGSLNKENYDNSNQAVNI